VSGGSGLSGVAKAGLGLAAGRGRGGDTWATAQPARAAGNSLEGDISSTFPFILLGKVGGSLLWNATGLLHRRSSCTTHSKITCNSLADSATYDKHGLRARRWTCYACIAVIKVQLMITLQLQHTCSTDPGSCDVSSDACGCNSPTVPASAINSRTLMEPAQQQHKEQHLGF
jgi:hypothetical protein